MQLSCNQKLLQGVSSSSDASATSFCLHLWLRCRAAEAATLASTSTAWQTRRLCIFKCFIVAALFYAPVTQHSCCWRRWFCCASGCRRPFLLCFVRPSVRLVAFSLWTFCKISWRLLLFFSFFLRTAAFTRFIFVHTACKSNSWHWIWSLACKLLHMTIVILFLVIVELKE